MKRKISELIIIIFFYLLQVTLGRVISIASISPNFLIILPVVFGFLNGKNEGIYVGFVSGFIYEILFHSVIGYVALVYMLVGYCSGFFYQKYEEQEIIIPISIVAVSDLAFEFISYVGYFMLHNKLDIFFYLRKIIIPEAVYTVLITIVLYKLLVYINSKLDSVDGRRAKDV